MREILLIAAILSLCWLISPLARQGRNVALSIVGVTHHCLLKFMSDADQVYAARQPGFGWFQLFCRVVRKTVDVGKRVAHAYQLVAAWGPGAADDAKPSHPSRPSQAWISAGSLVRHMLKIARGNRMPHLALEENALCLLPFAAIRAVDMVTLGSMFRYRTALSHCNITLIVLSAASWPGLWSFQYMRQVKHGIGWVQVVVRCYKLQS